LRIGSVRDYSCRRSIEAEFLREIDLVVVDEGLVSEVGIGGGEVSEDFLVVKPKRASVGLKVVLVTGVWV